MYLTDQSITCSDCQAEFVFTSSEQEFYQQKGFSAPRRCKSCRAAAKAARGDSGASSSRPAMGGRGPARQMYDVTCAACGVETQVPFKPSGEKPVYCRDCFKR